MNEYYDYDEALKVNRERKRKAAALKRKRQAQIRLIKRNILCAVILVALTLLVIQFLRHIVPDISRQNELKQEMVLADTGNYDDVITVVQEKPTFRYALKSVMYKEMTDTDIQSPYMQNLPVFHSVQLVHNIRLPDIPRNRQMDALRFPSTQHEYIPSLLHTL